MTGQVLTVVAVDLDQIDILTRAGQDTFAVRSHDLASVATTDGKFADEIVPVEIKSRHGTTTVTDDEGIRGGTTVDSLGKRSRWVGSPPPGDCL
ncbi:hypothetical protein R3Q08_31555 [Rhodococcus erythropolis]|uniref:thiolase family protein n=1 Tax=Rhodococcus erythropolis TaxID=1833 RepID=UPI002949E22E|nr:hypothetical protein [Rhodococcus erythropolis]MDV6212792.1 hypothetical protein [Rhodococcus erythropolis]